MTPDRWPDIERAFLAALRASPEAREQAVRTACAGDDALAAEVRALLEASDAAAAFFEQPSGLRGALVDAAAAAYTDAEGDGVGLAEGTRLGPWRVGPVVGRGGMGVVHLAERADGMFEQQAALKVVKRGMDTAAVLRRFGRERAVLAGLDHPAVARLLDGGAAPDGRPYLVLEYVDGEPITAYADRCRLDARERVALALQVCAAVAYAHRSLVLHRDLKPSNVLVDDGGHVKLVDFGVAGLLLDGSNEETALTVGAGPHTPAYAAPEVLAGRRATTAADIYGLGAVLYEVLCGRRPPRPERPDALPPPPSRAAPAGRAGALRGDLDAVCLRALRPDPAERYPSVDALADDLQRYLDGRPVAARRGTATYRAGKFVRRRGRALAVGALVVAALAGLAGRVVHEGRVAADERDKAELVAAFLEGLFLEVDPGGGRGGAVTVRQVLDEGAVRADDLDAAPEIQAHMLDVIARVYRALGLYDQAEPTQRKAAALAARTVGPEHPQALATHHHLAYLLDAMGHTDEADSLYASVLAARRRSGDPDGLVESLGDYGAFLGARDPEAAERLAREGLAVLDRHPEAGPPDQGGDRARAGFELQLGHVARARGDAARAERAYRASTRRYRVSFGPDHPFAALAEVSLAALLVERGRAEEAEPLARHALDVLGRAFGPDHPFTVRALTEHERALREVRP